MPFRFQIGDENLAVAAGSDGVNLAWILEVIGVQLPANDVELRQMAVMGDIRHDDGSSTEFIEMSFLDFGVLEVRKTHAPAVVGWANFDRLCRHDHPFPKQNQ